MTSSTNILPKLKYADCATCPLAKSKQVDFDIPTDESGRPEANIDYVCMGMHPGSEEVRANRVFHGPSGKILRQSLAQLKIEKIKKIKTEEKDSSGKSITITKSNVAFINAVACAPSRDEYVNEQARQHCQPAIHAIINEINPKMLMAMGPEALKTAGVWRGSILEHNGTVDNSKHPNLDGLKVVSLVHPAYFLRENNAERFSDWVNALYYAVKNDANPVPYPNVIISKSLEQTKEILASFPTRSQLKASGINKEPLVSLDIETQNLKLFRKILCLSLSVDGKTGYVIPWPENIDLEFSYDLKEWVPIIPDGEAREFYDVIKAFLESDEYDFNLQNAMFDVPYFKPYGIHVKIKHDTLLMAHIINENSFDYGLKNQARVRFSWPEWDEALEEYLPVTKKSRNEFDWGKIPREILYLYAGWDSPATHLLKIELASEMDENDIRVYETITIPTLNMYTHLRFLGVRVDLRQNIKIIDNLDIEIAEVYERIRNIAVEHGMGAFNPASNPEKAKLLFDKLGFKEVNGRSVSKKEVLERLPPHPLVADLMEWGELAHDRSAYAMGIGKFIYPDHAIHPMFNLTLKTGRASATDPSVFNVKKESTVRTMFIPTDPDEYEVFEQDQSQCELRVFAGVTQSRTMISIFQEGVDIHGRFMVIINPELAKLGKEELAKGGFRTRTKNVVFGKMYNASVVTMANSMLVSALKEMKKTDIERFKKISTNPTEYAIFYQGLLKEAKRINEELDKICPELSGYVRDRIREMETTGQVLCITGRKRRMPLVTSQTRAHSINVAVNSPIQTPANEINWYGMTKVFEKYDHYRKRPPIRLWWSIHDSIVGEVRKDVKDEVLRDIKRICETAPIELLGDKYPIFKEVPFKVDVKTGPNWGELKDYHIAA